MLAINAYNGAAQLPGRRSLQPAPTVERRSPKPVPVHPRFKLAAASSAMDIVDLEMIARVALAYTPANDP